MATALLSLGSNRGDRQRSLETAVAQLCGASGIGGISVSSFHGTQPVGGPAGQAPFLNAAARLETTLAPPALLNLLQEIEQRLGRTRSQRWDARTLDLDLLLCDDQVLDDPNLIVPHRFLPFRRFVLAPAAEVAAELVHPTLGWSIATMLRHLDATPPVFATVGDTRAQCEELARRVAEAIGGESRSDGTRLRIIGPNALCETDDPIRGVLALGGRHAEIIAALPTLHLPADDLNTAVFEAVAAVQSG
jgi:2-amino-4-hydroxy-6-hydroxymethyldihydropteridine diphosphokinase